MKTTTFDCDHQLSHVTQLLPADYAWCVIVTGGIVFELLSKDDLLSDASERLCNKHPVLARVVILALAGHLAVVLPHHIDLFNAKNIFHRGIAYGYRRFACPA